MGFEYFKSMLLLCKIFGNTEYSKDMKTLGLLFRSLPTFLYHGQVEMEKWYLQKPIGFRIKRNLIKSLLPPVTCLRWLWLLLDVSLRINILTLQSKYLFCDLTKRNSWIFPEATLSRGIVFKLSIIHHWLNFC